MQERRAVVPGVENAQVRPAGEDDLTELIAAPWTANLAATHTDRFTLQERDAAVYLVALVDGTIVGHLLLKWDGPDGDVLRSQLAPCAEIEDLRVVEELRSRGIGSALLDHAAALTVARGQNRLGLAVGLDNDRARALYERVGFAQVDIPPFDVRWQYRTPTGELAWGSQRCSYMIKPLLGRGSGVGSTE
jgi:ribosomal protein S18 acetylase RimI-like enzyme